ncbi:MAG: Hsp20/alpha crystallin family protein [Gammaproteobacteria bacterium]|nr:Hsp20/alpha crystallin family protein [Gammaproteobacteria bacterium]
MELPAVASEDVKVNVKDGVLLVRLEKEAPVKPSSHAVSVK